ncbi:MAG: glycosyltransferase [Desulfobacteraceae bacterium]|nr:glycosyltransferase [Desulfobacteraceae bacterium]MBC2753397.1 glycosyltransferase [Desulfobacteraceae bacterium]
MAQNGTFNILMYSHDTYGLGHIRRTMAIASQLCSDGINILILTGSPIAGRFAFPEQIDFVRIPGMIKKTNEEYRPLSIKINPRHALDIRKNIITATAKTFQPHLFIVDKEPLGLKKEVLPTLRWIRRCLPHARTILGLRDIMDDAETVRRDWWKKNVYENLDKLYSEIWIYGNKEFYDPITEYAIPESVKRKMLFTGYIPRQMPSNREAGRIRRELRVDPDEKLIVVTTGGGGDGFKVMDTYLAMLEKQPLDNGIKSVLVTGPFMPKQERKRLFKRARKVNAQTFLFYRRMEKLMAAADLVVSMGGYNTLSEVVSQGTLSLVIPRETPRTEQLLRAKAFKKQGLIDYIPWNDFSAPLLRTKIEHLLANPERYYEALAGFRFTGIDSMRRRIQAFRSKVNVVAC